MEIGSTKKSDHAYGISQQLRISGVNLTAANSQLYQNNIKNSRTPFDFIAPIKHKHTHKSHSVKHIRLHSSLEASLQHNKAQKDFIPLNSYRHANPVKIRNISDISLPKLDLKHLQRNNAQPRGLFSNNLEFSSVNYTPNLPVLSQNGYGDVSYSSRRQVSNKSLELGIENQYSDINRERNFFTVKPLGKQKRIRNLADMYENMHMHPQSDLLDSQRSAITFDSHCETENNEKLSSNKQFQHQILEISNEDSLLADSSVSKLSSQPIEYPYEPIYINTNNIYKQRALLKKQTISQIKSDTMKYLKTSLTRRKDFELSSVLKIRKN